MTLIGNEAHVEAINSKGLELLGDMERKFFVRAGTKIKNIPSNTLILLTTKAQDSAKAIKGTKALLKEDTVILILQNGLGNKELVKGIVGDKISVVRGLVKMAVEFLEPGRITFWNGETILEQTENAERITTLFEDCGLETRVSSEMERELWNKLVTNCVVNPLTAILQVRDHKIVVESLKAVREGIIEECIQVGKCEEIAFPPDLKESIDESLSRYRNLSSMCQDIMKGKKTEIDFLNGKVVELARKHHISTPINETMVYLIKFLETNK